MADREKVLRAIEHHTIKENCYSGDGCPYADDLTTCIKRLLADAAELLQDPEPVPVEAHKKGEWHCRCVASPDRVAEWMADADRTHYCPNCGRRVFWEVDADGRG